MEFENNIEYLNLENGMRVIPPKFYPQTFPLHCHSCIEIIAIPEKAKSKQCAAVVRVNEIIYQLFVGDILFIWPGELHEVLETDGHSPMAIQYNPSFIQDLSELAPYTSLFRSYQFISRDEMTELSDTLIPHIHKMTIIKQERKSFYKTKCVASLIEMFVAFANYLKNGNNRLIPRPRSLKNMEKINDACSYIIANCQLDLTLETVANYVGFNPCYLSRVFKQTTGYHFVEYLMLQRVNSAQLLLSDSHLTITEVAFASGFKSISSFNRVFKQYRGCSPREYRKTDEP